VITIACVDLVTYVSLSFCAGVLLVCVLWIREEEKHGEKENDDGNT